MSDPRVLILFLHPAFERSKVHRALVDGVRDIEGVTFHDLYERYPDFDIDVEAEQRLLANHDRIVFQHPTYWYSGPPLLKQWQDLVLEHGWAYGSQGHALEGKWVLHVTSTGGDEVAYSEKGFHGHTLTEFFRPLERTATLCRMAWLPPYVVFAGHHLDAAQRDQHAQNYRRLLEALRDDRVDRDLARRLAHLNDDPNVIGVSTPQER